jgi:D-amino-acid oxidase
MQSPVGRRNFLFGSSAVLCATALDGCDTVRNRQGSVTAPVQLPTMRVSVDRITGITVCTRPFRAVGPRLDVEQIGQRTIVHNYGHGGSGWSLSWGSSTIAVRNALATGARDIGVIGCGALGLTSGTLALRAGLRVTIYAKDRPPDVRSSLATGLWTPDSRICLEESATPAFKRSWEEMCRISFATYQNYLGLPGEPVELIDSYYLTDDQRGRSPAPPATDLPKFAELRRELVPDLSFASEDLSYGRNPFPTAHAIRSSTMMFNLTGYARLLMSDFLANGGLIETRQFDSPNQLSELPQKTLINATGYGARALFRDETITPVRGQLARLIPQPELHYSVVYDNVLLAPRRDGLVVQALGPNEGFGFGDDSTLPDRTEAVQAVQTIAGLSARMQRSV